MLLILFMWKIARILWFIICEINISKHFFIQYFIQLKKKIAVLKIHLNRNTYAETQLVECHIVSKIDFDKNADKIT